MSGSFSESLFADMTARKWAFYIFWYGVHAGVFIFGFFKQRMDGDLQLLNSLGYSVATSRGAGLVLAMDCCLLTLPMCRNLIRFARNLRIVNRILPFDQNIFFHKMAAYSLLFFTLVHVNAHYVNFFFVESKIFDKLPVRAWQIHYTTYAGVTGHIMLVLMFIMYSAAKTQVRQKKFELFWYAHHLFVLFYVCLFLHYAGCFVKSNAGKCKPYGSNIYTVPCFCLYILERIVREYRARQSTQLSKVIMHPGNTIELRIEKASFAYKPGQYLFLNIPDIAYFQWHPFTISSTPEEGFVSVHIRVVGDWTKKAAKLLGAYSTSDDSASTLDPKIRLPTIRIDGPFGAPAEDFYNYRSAVLVSAGIGVTPAASLLKSLWYRYYRKAPIGLRKVYFFWLARDKESFSWFQSLLSTLEQSIPSSFLEIHVYLTGNLSVDDIQNLALNDNSAYDALTELRNKTHFGRPDWAKAFGNVRAAVEREVVDPKLGGGAVDVGVFYCGPSPLASVLRKSCAGASGGGVNFEFRKEHF
ncbi:ferric reductase NAD binding domain-containing protein [Fimicolochytrium jonesii]|uniref:ferric reductase NAD binding domain-containing protein n=1 Tax=Fimicolochytrium jonesii TaxID=1396493 RepID=UPI0022FF14D7|nr:ferric reductase NAD binding domain-containing protein [Fimicolochytrium jonesii]KAI8818569.1 ferric reductase NAD binding domain-containing protein [Fimicolochytrium jonesii]